MQSDQYVGDEMTKRCVGFAIAVLVFSLVPVLSFGQVTTGNINGTVTDPQGAAVAGAKVTITDVAKGTTDTTTTNDSGNYTVTHLIPDPYTVKIEAPGFKTFQQNEHYRGGRCHTARRCPGRKSGRRRRPRKLRPKLRSCRPITRTSASAITSATWRTCRSLTATSRQFELLSPGTQQLAGWNHAATENPQGGLQIFVNGQHFSGTGFQLDGTDNQDPILGIIVINPNLDAITQATVGSQFYDAEQGKAIAGLVTAQTKSGTNEFHGSGFWFRRTDANLARDPFTQYARQRHYRQVHSVRQVEPVRRHHRRPDHQEQVVLLWRLSGHQGNDRCHQRAYRSDDTSRPDLYRCGGLLQSEPVPGEGKRRWPGLLPQCQQHSFIQRRHARSRQHDPGCRS